MELSRDLLVAAFSDSDIMRISREYKKRTKKVLSRHYFDSPGNWTGRNDRFVDPGLSDGFDRLLYGTNIAILDYCIKNKAALRNLVFLDYGAGVGVLGLFLEVLGIKCLNYDDFSQTGKNLFATDIMPPGADV